MVGGAGFTAPAKKSVMPRLNWALRFSFWIEAAIIADLVPIGENWFLMAIEEETAMQTLNGKRALITGGAVPGKRGVVVCDRRGVGGRWWWIGRLRER